MTTETERKTTILIVDDIPLNIKTLSSVLREDYQISIATSGKEALALLEKGLRPELILLDIVMPELDGYEICRRLKADERFRDIPVIFISARSDEEDETKGFESGAVDYITKPFSVPVVRSRVATHSQLRRYQAQLEEIVTQRTGELRESAARLIRINTAYQRFIPMEFLELLGKDTITDVDLGDHVEKEMTILFADIRRFTTLTESMSPDDSFRFINEYLGRVVPVIRAHGGIIDKYIGDAIMALFPDRDNGCDQAVKAAMEMQRTVDAYSIENQRAGKPAIQIGIGLHFGELMLGIVGERERVEGTVISDAVNQASRLEGLTKEYGSRIILSEEALDHIPAGTAPAMRFLDTIQVDGKILPISIYEIIESDPPEQRVLKEQTLKQYQQGWDLYREGRIEEAIETLQDILRENPADKAARYHLERCREFIV